MVKKSIYEKQNEEIFLKCIVAQRREYSKAKRINTVKSLLNIGFLFFLIIVSWIDSDKLTAISVLFSILLAVSSKYFDEAIKKHKNIAVSIQQYFDVKLYSYILENDEKDWGEIFNFLQLSKFINDIDINKIKKEEDSKIENWYGDYSKLEPKDQVFSCQMENLRWDYDLKKSYRNFKIAVFIPIVIIVMGLFLLNNISLIQFLIIIGQLLPILEFIWANFKSMNESINYLEKIDGDSNRIQNKMMEIEDLISFQYSIRENRKKCVFIPDWFYNLNRSKHQTKRENIANTIQNLSCEDGKKDETRNQTTN